MKAENWEKIKDVFAQVLEQPENRREDFLGEACEGDTVLLEEVRSLLAALDEPENLIENNAFHITSDAVSNGKNYAGKQFGKYKIIREIGRGGMGAVFLAERSDGEFEHQVALKIVRRSFADERIESQFRRERQILASLNHPNIARLLDGGVSEHGEPFLVMEYVDGEPLNEFAEKHNLSVEERLKLFQKVCSAISYAHRNLIIHRDLKPSNILVDKEGEPKLLDFGLAKILDDGLRDDSQTEIALRAFTPAYASPEQIQDGRVTTASDVYSLGVVLYELLTGDRPFDFEHKSYQEILRSIDTLKPPRPSSVVNSRWSVVSNATNRNKQTTKREQQTNPQSAISNPQSLQGDLDNIVLMSLRKEPERRYESVEQFSQDIKRHLNNLPVLARPQTASYRAVKFFSRNKIAVSALAVIILALATGFSIALWQANAAQREALRAEKRFGDVRNLSNALLFEIAPKIERLDGSLEAHEALVNQSLKYLDSLAQEAGGDLELQSELASAYEKIGDLQGNPTNPNFIEFEAALQNYQKARAIREIILEKIPNDATARKNLAENYRVTGNIYSQTNEFDNSMKNTTAALQIYEVLAAEQPDSAERRFNLAKVNYDFGLNLQSNKKYNDSLPYFERAKTLLLQLNDDAPNNLETIKTLAECKAQYALALSWMKKQAGGEEEIKEAIAIYEPLLADNPNDVSIRNGMWLAYWLACSIYQDQNDELAYQYALKAMKTAQETVSKDPANIRAKQKLAKSFSTLGDCATTVKKTDEAIAYLEKACQIQQEITENASKNNRLKSELALSRTRLGAAQAERGQFADSLENLRHAEQIYREILQNTPNDRRSNRNLVLTYEQIAETNEKLYQKEKSENYKQSAKEYYQKAFDILSQLKNSNSLAEADNKLFDSIKAKAEK